MVHMTGLYLRVFQKRYMHALYLNKSLLLLVFCTDCHPQFTKNQNTYLRFFLPEGKHYLINAEEVLLSGT